ncbi:MAG: HAD family phosphatase [Oscillospiraceae bacterium]|nr:HAD family phosphatase [Oscillospiraceae bacterium]
MAYHIYKPEWGAARPIRGVLFDMDGLVLDTEKLFSRFWMAACQFYGYPMTVEQSLKMRSLSKTAGQEMLCSFFGPGISYPQVRAKRIELMDAFIKEHGVEPKPGIFQLMDALEERGIPAAITSSSPVSRIEEYLKPLGLYHRFAKICSGHEVPNGKPAPDIYLHGAAQLGLKPEECLALEDSPAGILSAYRAGCLPVMIPDLDTPDAETLPRLFAQADSLAEIIDLLGPL